MTRFRLSYVNAFRDRHGKPRHYFRRPGHLAVSLPGLPGSAEFMAAYQAALANVKPSAVGAARTKPGSINELIVTYYSHRAFTEDLGPATQAMRKAILERFRFAYGDGGAQTLQREHIERLLDKMKPYAARNWLKTLRGSVTCDDGKVRSYRIHGLRKAACCQLAYAGCTAAEIMAVSAIPRSHRCRSISTKRTASDWRMRPL